MTEKRLKAPFDDYAVSDDGKVWSFKGAGGKKSEVASREDKDGYLRVNLANSEDKNGFREVYIHKLVARAFLGKGQGQVLHKDGNNQNNAIGNLSYGSAATNAKQREAHARGDSCEDDDIEFSDKDDIIGLWRFDSSVKAEWEITPEGYLHAKRVVVAQAKEYRYKDPSFPSGERVEFVTVPALESLARTLVGKPVTLEHPPAGRVTAETWRLLSRGVVAQAWVEHPSEHNDLEFPSCVVEAYVHDQELVNLVLKENLREVSPGYDATLAIPPASATEYSGANFLQTSRAGNHLAITKAGRGGSASRIRLDSQGHAINEDTMTPEEMKTKLDAAEKAQADMQTKLDAQQAKIDAFEMASKKKEEAPVEKPEEKRMDSKDYIGWYNERQEAEAAAVRVSAKYDKNATTLEIKNAVIKAQLGEGFRRLDSESEINGAFEAVVAMLPAPNTGKDLADRFRRADSTSTATKTSPKEDVLGFYDKKGN